MLSDKNSNKMGLSSLITKYLFSYRNTPHSTTGQTPSKLMFSRKVKTRFDFLTSPDFMKARERQIQFHRGNRVIDLEEGEEVYVRDYRSDRQKPTWSKCKIVSRLGLQTYMCKLLDNPDVVWKRHIDQIIRVGKFYERIPTDLVNTSDASSTQLIDDKIDINS
ncbi:hypothetical protein QE152_g30687 [Popillia japonica]|uniref:Uncharacterized protein n=1 Tax=Popillia japonica TaxID=7064 RepID=A0AAW1JE27_POPJA